MTITAFGAKYSSFAPATILVALVFLLGVSDHAVGQGAQSLTQEGGGVKVTLMLSDFTMDKQGAIVARGRGGMLVGDFLPSEETAALEANREREAADRSFLDETTVWVEPTTDPRVLQLILDADKIPQESLAKLGLAREQVPEMKLFIRIDTRTNQISPIIGTGATLYGATKGAVVLGGKQVSAMKGTRVVGAELVAPVVVSQPAKPSSGSAKAETTQTPKEAIGKVVAEAMSAWNRKDYPGFLKHFVASPRLPAWAKSQESFANAEKPRKGDMTYKIEKIDITSDGATVRVSTVATYDWGGMSSTGLLYQTFALRFFPDGWRIVSFE